MLRFPLIQDLNSLEMMPVLSCTEYPWSEGSSYMPFMTARIALVQGEGAVFDLFAFDTEPTADPEADHPLDDHLLAAVFNFFPAESGTTLGFAANAFDKCMLYVNGEAAGTLPCLRTAGEDERGIYWNVRVTLPCALLQQHYGKALPENGAQLMGNIFKAKRIGPKAHLGAVAPAVKNGFLFEAENANAFLVTAL